MTPAMSSYRVDVVRRVTPHPGTSSSSQCNLLETDLAGGSPAQCQPQAHPAVAKKRASSVPLALTLPCRACVGRMHRNSTKNRRGTTSMGPPPALTADASGSRHGQGCTTSSSAAEFSRHDVHHWVLSDAYHLGLSEGYAHRTSRRAQGTPSLCAGASSRCLPAFGPAIPYPAPSQRPPQWPRRARFAWHTLASTSHRRILRHPTTPCPSVSSAEM
mmetsp:Transcript_8898/g.21301  ORF Transcript_8898/g.21301 Transcript_8898/m.21301 type:complete len:216 (+) Transcript_8898:503-1150(+)